MSSMVMSFMIEIGVLFEIVYSIILKMQLIKCLMLILDQSKVRCNDEFKDR